MSSKFSKKLLKDGNMNEHKLLRKVVGVPRPGASEKLFTVEVHGGFDFSFFNA